MLAKKDWLSDGRLTRIYLVHMIPNFGSPNRVDTVLPTTLQQRYIYGEKLKDCVRLIVDERYF